MPNVGWAPVVIKVVRSRPEDESARYPCTYLLCKWNPRRAVRFEEVEISVQVYHILATVLPVVHVPPEATVQDKPLEIDV